MKQPHFLLLSILKFLHLNSIVNGYSSKYETRIAWVYASKYESNKLVLSQAFYGANILVTALKWLKLIINIIVGDMI